MTGFLLLLLRVELGTLIVFLEKSHLLLRRLLALSSASFKARGGSLWPALTALSHSIWFNKSSRTFFLTSILSKGVANVLYLVTMLRRLAGPYSPEDSVVQRPAWSR